MDPALPPGGLQQIFAQYDAIRSHSTRDDGPAPWEEPDPVKKAPQGVTNSQLATPALTNENSHKVTNSQLATPALTSGERPRGRPKAWADTRDEKAQQLMEENLKKSYSRIDKQNETIDERLRQAREKKLYDTRIKNPQGATFAQDEEGMNAAYGYRSYPGVAIRRKHPDPLCGRLRFMEKLVRRF